MKKSEELSWRYWFLCWGLVLSFGVLLSGAFRLSIIRKKFYQSIARDNKIVEKIIPAARGKIFDRKGRILSESVYQYFKIEEGNKLYDTSGEFQGYKFEGEDLAYELKRRYPYKEATAFVTGYVSKMNEKDIKLDKCKTILSRDAMVGRGGVEETMNCVLTGKDGKRLIEVDATGKYVREMGRLEPEVGKDLNLSIDAFWQDKIYKMISEKKVVVIMSEPDTGKVVSFVSSPAFDPNIFSFNKDDDQIKNYFNDKGDLPMLNRISSARYHPGSVFKIVMAIGGLESGVIDRSTLIEDTGVIKVGDYTYSNWLWTKRGGTDGMVDIIKALKKSNDIYFYKLGERMGAERIKVWADKFGYGKETGIEIPGELAGIVPDEKWKKEVKGEGWYLGNTYHLSIGQGDLSVTPLQVNQMTNIIANRGIKCQLSLLKDKKSECEDLKIKPSNLQTVFEGMKEVCKSGGTAWPLFNFKTSIACKTGTAEVGDGSKDTHAWLTAFAPADNPQISITVLVERGGEGSDVAAPIMGDILKEWFNEPETIVPRY